MPAGAATPACSWARPQAPGPKERAGGLGLLAAYDVRKLDEDERLLRKHSAGFRFFISRTVFDASATKSLLSHYARENLARVPFILSFPPCGSLKTVEFMKWLGISFPRWLGRSRLRDGQGPPARGQRSRKPGRLTF